MSARDAATGESAGGRVESGRGEVSARLSIAPMEGIGTCYFRRVHHRLFPEGLARYYTPFLSVYPNLAFHRRDFREILPPENASGEEAALQKMLVPQIMARSAGEIVWAVKKLAELGFHEVNLNLGCPSGTVVKKGGGAGMLADPQRLDRVLDGVFSDPGFAACGAALSVKTRLGLCEPTEFYDILPVFNRYPVKEIILHPRVQREQYGGKPHRELFAWAAEHAVRPLAYSGDLFSAGQIRRFAEEFPEVSHILIGRGAVSDPALAREAAGGAALTLEELKEFVRQITEEYAAALDGERPLLFKLKELWYYMGARFVLRDGTEAEKYVHRIRTAKNMGEYRNAVRAIYENCVIGGYFTGIS